MKASATARHLARQLCPPLMWEGLRAANAALRSARSQTTTAVQSSEQGHSGEQHHPDEQDLELYWDPKMAEILESWGEDTVWKEVQLLLVGRAGRVLDIACGSGRAMEILGGLPIELHGCDISELLIEKAAARGIQPSRLTVCDATRLPYEASEFDYAYSIGSLEHFTEDGIERFLAESRRVCRKASFHNIPVSRSGRNEGWISPYQSYFNNSVDWWLAKFQSACENVTVIDSTWQDDRSVGKWFVSLGSGPGSIS